MIYATSIDDVREAVTSHPRIKVSAGGSKPALTDGANLSLQKLSGVSEYQPSEYTFTALAGTMIAEVENMLAENRQYLPFDPPFPGTGATLGGTVAAGLSGSGRYRYGGVRDFLIGATFISGDGRQISGGGKVVKNAAGFDIPKLMVGSLGRFGVLVELTFKVFPARDGSATLAIETDNPQAAVELMKRLTLSGEDLDHLDLEPPGRIVVRISGLRDALNDRVDRLKALLSTEVTLETIEDGATYWRSVRDFEWAPADHTLLKVPLVPDGIARVENAVKSFHNVARRYSVGGNVGWLAFPARTSLSEIESLFDSMKLAALVLRGTSAAPLLGSPGPNEFEHRLLQIFDPDGKFRNQ